MNHHSPVLKHRPNDFTVSEVLMPASTSREMATHRYYLLTKTGLTTMEAVRIIGKQFCVPATEVTYGGLKDEDAVTEQLIAIPVGNARQSDFDYSDGDCRRLQLMARGYGPAPLRIGRLEGNAFAVTLRDVDPDIAARLAAARDVTLYFFNYYDIQRFGVPGGRRRTHLLGRYLLDGVWDSALEELRNLRCPESALAQAWAGSAKGFFTDLDPRIASFYLASHGSAEWNKQLGRLVADLDSGDGLCHIEVEGIPFTYARLSCLARAALAAVPQLEYPRYTFSPDGITEQKSARTSVIQTRIAFDEEMDDDVFPGRSSLIARFFLPSGCYATAALRQLFSRADLTEEADPC